MSLLMSQSQVVYFIGQIPRSIRIENCLNCYGNFSSPKIPLAYSCFDSTKCRCSKVESWGFPRKSANVNGRVLSQINCCPNNLSPEINNKTIVSKVVLISVLKTMDANDMYIKRMRLNTTLLSTVDK